MSETPPILTRSQFVRAGFCLEWEDGQPVLYTSAGDGTDWQRFKSREHMAVWIATAISEMEHEDFMAEMEAKLATLTINQTDSHSSSATDETQANTDT
jgi:hypothetical protein